MIKANTGKVFRRISDGIIFGNEMYLGMAYPKDGEPYLELPEHYEEIDELITEDTVIIADDEPLPIEPLPEQPESSPPLPEPSPKRITYSDYRELEKKVEMLIQLLTQ